MDLFSQRYGIFLKQKRRSKAYVPKFFFIDNDYNVRYSSSQAFFERSIKSSDTFNDVVSKLSVLKKLSIRNAKIGQMKIFATVESIPIAFKNCFEIFPQNQDNKHLRQLIFFSYQDDDIAILHDFLKNYDEIVSSLHKTKQTIRNPAKKSFPPIEYVNPENTGGEDGPGGEAGKTPEILLKILENYKQNLKQKSTVDRTRDFEFLTKDLRGESTEEENEQQLKQLENGNTYSGKLLNGLPHGQGTEFIPDGTSYVGEFRNGRWHGVGYIVDSNLDITYGEFIYGRPVGI